MMYSAGSLVRARGREWVVLPESTDALLLIQPLGGTDLEKTALLPVLEKVESASFSLPDPEHLGDLLSARLLRDAVRLGFRSSSGPFRSLGSIAVEPRPYQLVPLLMSLRLSPVRLLIADDVGIGKTIEAGLIAKELLARGEVDRLCVLCPPQLAEQWQSELEQKFNLSPVLVLPSTVTKLERECPPNISVFEQFPVTIVSLDYIKQQSRRDDFIRTCPSLIIVDEAHTCTQGGQNSQLRFQLLQRLAANPERHMVMVTATPHSGNDQAFRSMLSLLKNEFALLPEDLSGDANRPYREQLASHFVQRRRADIEHFLHEDTPFPERKEKEETYRLHPEYRKFMDRALHYAREVVKDNSGTKFQQRIRWWSALALLRSISSSPAAAVATLRARANNADSDDLQQIEELGRRSVMDMSESETVEGFDVTPGAEIDKSDTPTRRIFLELARIAEGLIGLKDHKIQGLAKIVEDLLKDGFSPVVFCKYISTAEYVAEELRKCIKKTEIACVTGTLPHDEREARVHDLALSPKRVLVCTDCLSEGINLQDNFDAVVHADLAWSPTRHEQREGRVDRFNQKSPFVRVVTYYGEDNPIDGIVLKILIRKHKTIRSSLGISVPVPAESEQVLEAIFEALLLRGMADPLQLSFERDLGLNESKNLNDDWDSAVEREKLSRTIFAQHSIKAEEVSKELEEVRQALGTTLDLERFVRNAVTAHKGRMDGEHVITVKLDECPLALKDAVLYDKPFQATFESPPPRGAIHLTRTHPFVESLASYVLDSALDEDDGAVAARCSVTATDAVKQLTTLLVLRCRFQLISGNREMLAEEAITVGFRGMPDNPEWLRPEETEPLLGVRATGNIPPDQAKPRLRIIMAGIPRLRIYLREFAKMRAEKALESHRRVRKALRGVDSAREVRVQGEPDILGLYLLVPHGGNS